ncbi:type VI secretion protein [Escherichia coli]|nr:type VI secretion protein [Escherichia coli]EFF9624346.1 type VI secretion protein [Escherichia coli]EIN5716686.1 type VI secretion protein [Escherichia coli]ELG2550108.1 type VI secretion protein [Escherichia coli]ELN6856714.1 type VI secretion protein [Escherichia coli]
MLKKTFNLFLWLIISVLIFSFFYVIGVLKNWSDSKIFFYWVTLIFFTLLVKCFMEETRAFFLGGCFKQFIKNYSSGFRKSAIYRYQRRSLKIINKKRRGKLPWFLLTGHADNNESLLKGVNLPLFHCTGRDYIKQPIRSVRWWFFHNLSILELSDRVYTNSKLFTIIIELLTLRVCKKILPSGIIIVIPLDTLLNGDCTAVQELAQKYRSFVEQLSSRLNYNIPVFLMLNHCDKIPGFSTLSNHLLAKDKKIIPGIMWTSGSFSNQDAYLILSDLKKCMNSIIFSNLDNSFNDKELNEVLQFPDKLMDIQNSLNVFLSTFCLVNSHFPATNLSGLWLTGATPSISGSPVNLLDTLISETLPKIYGTHLNSNISTKKTIVLRSVTVLSILCFLGYSAYKTALLYSEHNLRNPELITQALLQNEMHHQSPLIYFPFYPILKIKNAQLNEILMAQTKITIYPVSDIIERYNKIFSLASLQDRRKMILSLASLVSTWEKMRDNTPLSELAQEPNIPALLRLIKTEDNISVFTSLAVERAFIQKSDGVKNIRALRELLTALINRDSTYAWLISSHSDIPDIKLSYFWDDADPSIILSGIWTTEGQKTLHKWYMQITDVYRKSEVPEGLLNFVQHINESRQDNFRQFILSAGKARQASHYRLMDSLQLTNLVMSRSPELKFFQFIEKELRDIPTTLAHDWLIDFRLFYRLHSLVRENSIIRYIKQSELILRTHFLSTFNNELPITPERLAAWWEWQDALRTVVNEEMDIDSSVNLIRGKLLTDQKLNKNDALFMMFKSFNKLKSLFINDNNDPLVKSLWTIYEKQIYQLLDNAVSQTDCWINEKWKNSVLQPLNTRVDNVSHSEIQKKTYRNIISFLNGPLKGLIELSSDDVKIPSFKGRTISFTPSFINFINKVVTPDDLLDVQLQERTHDKDELSDLRGELTILNEKLKVLESKPYNIIVKTAPATISGNSRIKPIGTYLKLECDTGNTYLRSMNLADSGSFTWYPGQCQNVNIDIYFPTFSVSYVFSGESAWIDFIKTFTLGNSELLTENFPIDSKNLLEAMNIKSILVRYTLNDSSIINQAYIEWNQLKQRIDEKQQLQSELTKKIFSPSKQDQVGWLSYLPQNITTCPMN